MPRSVVKSWTDPNSVTRSFMIIDDKTLKLQGVYNTLYNATTRPDFKFAITRYFIDEWVPILGPSLAWLIVGLRQQCFWNRRRDWCVVDKETLSCETALDERTIERCLKKPLSNWFVIDITHRYRYRHQIGKKVRDKNRYQLLLDEPLSPRHQMGLAALLRQIAPANPDPVEAALTTLEIILAMPDLPDKISYTGQIPKNLQRRTILELVEETLSLNLTGRADDGRVVLLDQRCSKLYNLIVQPNKVYIGWQYFRLEWVHLLGHALAWVIINLRRRCYWDETSDELRDMLTIYKKDLAATIGQTTRNLANLLDNPYASLFFTPLNPDIARNKPVQYKVRMVDEPLTPDDQQRTATKLRQQLQGNFYGQDPENGQLNMFPILDNCSSRQNFAYGQIPEKKPVSNQKKSRLEDNLSEKMPQHVEASIGKNVATLEDSLFPDSERVQQQIHPAVELKNLQLLLDDLSVQEPTRSKLLAIPDLTVARIGAWFLYAETQPNLFDPQRYVIKRLLANDPPPLQFLAFAQLDDTTWQLFEETVYALRTGQPLATEISPDLSEIFINWADVYGELDPAETQRLLSLSKQLPFEGDDQVAFSDDQPKEDVNLQLEIARGLWQTTLDQLQLQMTKQTFNTWLKQTEVLDYHDGIFVVDAKSSYAKEWLENRLIDSIKRALANVVGESTRVRFVLGSPN